MTKKTTPTTAELQERIYELEKSNNDYNSTFQTFVDGFVLDIASSSVKSIDVKTLQTWFSNPDSYITQISNLLSYYYISDGDIHQLYSMFTSLPKFDYKITCLEKTKSYEKDMITIKKALAKVKYKPLARNLLTQLCIDGTLISTWLGSSAKPYLYVFSDLKSVFPFGSQQGEMVSVFDLKMLDAMKPIERLALYSNLKPLVTQKKYEAWKNATDQAKKDELQYVILPTEKTTTARIGTLYNNQRYGIPLGTQSLFEINNKQKFKDLEISIAERTLKAISTLKFKGIDDNGNKVSDTNKAKVFASVKSALTKTTKTNNSNQISVIALPDFADFKPVDFNNLDKALDPSKYESIDENITNSNGIAKSLTGSAKGNSTGASVNLEVLYRKIGVPIEQIEDVFNKLIAIVLPKKCENYIFEFDKDMPLSKKEKVLRLDGLVKMGYSVKVLTDELNISFDEFIEQSIYEIETLKLRDRIVVPMNTNNISKGTDLAKTEPVKVEKPPTEPIPTE